MDKTHVRHQLWSVFFHLLKISLFGFSLVHFKGNLSLLDICLFFSPGGLKQMEVLVLEIRSFGALFLDFTPA